MDSGHTPSELPEPNHVEKGGMVTDASGRHESGATKLTGIRLRLQPLIRRELIPKTGNRAKRKSMRRTHRKRRRVVTKEVRWTLEKKKN